jgi:hypothetical protein
MSAKNYVETSDYLAMLRRMVQAAGKRIAKADVEDLVALAQIQGDLDDALQTAVDGLRADGYTWETIGAAFGFTKQAAIKRWARAGNRGRQVA